MFAQCPRCGKWSTVRVALLSGPRVNDDVKYEYMDDCHHIVSSTHIWTPENCSPDYPSQSID